MEGGGKRRRVDDGGAAAVAAQDEEEEEEDEEAFLRRALENDEIDEETIKKILEAADKQQDVVELDLPGVKKLFLGLERKIQANLLKRVKFSDEPAKFLDSELELYEEIAQFKAVAAAPALYPELVKLDVANSLLGLVTHENTDISIHTLGALAELTDPDVILEAEKEAATLIEALVDKNGLELLVQNLQRMDEGREDDVKGVLHTLQILENLVTVRPSLASLVCSKTSLLRVLLTRAKAKRFDDIKAYCAELLSILLAADTENQRRLGQLSGLNGMDTLLQAIAYYRRREATSPEEKECIENLFDCLCSCLLLPENQARFRQSEGLDLLLRCIREKKGGFLGAIKALDSACVNSIPNCEKFIDQGGLKALFPLFMGRGWGTALKGKRQGEKDGLTEQVVSLVASLCLHLMVLPEEEGGGGGGGGAEGKKHEVEEARLLGKFVEGGGEKVDRAVELFLKYHEKVERARARLSQEEEQLDEADDNAEEKAETRLARLMDAGLYMLQVRSVSSPATPLFLHQTIHPPTLPPYSQRLAVILGFVFSRSLEGQARLAKRMKMEGRELGEIADVLREYALSVGEDAEGAVAEGGGAARQRRRLRFWAAHLEAAGGEGEEEEDEGKEGGKEGMNGEGMEEENCQAKEEEEEQEVDELAKEA